MVGVVMRPNDCGWKRVGVERREEKDRDESIEGVFCRGICESLDQRALLSGRSYGSLAAGG